MASHEGVYNSLSRNLLIPPDKTQRIYLLCVTISFGVLMLWCLIFGTQSFDTVDKDLLIEAVIKCEKERSEELEKQYANTPVPSSDFTPQGLLNGIKGIFNPEKREESESKKNIDEAIEKPPTDTDTDRLREVILQQQLNENREVLVSMIKDYQSKHRALKKGNEKGEENDSADTSVVDTVLGVLENGASWALLGQSKPLLSQLLNNNNENRKDKEKDKHITSPMEVFVQYELPSIAPWVATLLGSQMLLCYRASRYKPTSLHEALFHNLGVYLVISLITLFALLFKEGSETRAYQRSLWTVGTLIAVHLTLMLAWLVTRSFVKRMNKLRKKELESQREQEEQEEYDEKTATEESRFINHAKAEKFFGSSALEDLEGYTSPYVYGLSHPTKEEAEKALKRDYSPNAKDIENSKGFCVCETESDPQVLFLESLLESIRDNTSSYKARCCDHCKKALLTHPISSKDRGRKTSNHKEKPICSTCQLFKHPTYVTRVSFKHLFWKLYLLKDKMPLSSFCDSCL